MNNYIFRIVIEEDPKEDGAIAYSAYCPALDGCVSWGYTPEEALTNIKEAIQGYLEDMISHGEPIPSDSIILKSKHQKNETRLVVNA
jgi:antitoxin HicB